MYRSPSPLSEDARKKIAESLNARLADGLDLHSQIKVAHWNIKGPSFVALHSLFETFAVSLAAHNDTIAERAVTLGAKAYGTARHVAKTSRLAEYPQETSRDLEHVKLLAERIETCLAGMRETREIAEKTATPTRTISLRSSSRSSRSTRGSCVRPWKADSPARFAAVGRELPCPDPAKGRADGPGESVGVAAGRPGQGQASGYFRKRSAAEARSTLPPERIAPIFFPSSRRRPE